MASRSEAHHRRARAPIEGLARDFVALTGRRTALSGARCARADAHRIDILRSGALDSDAGDAPFRTRHTEPAAQRVIDLWPITLRGTHRLETSPRIRRRTRVRRHSCAEGRDEESTLYRDPEHTAADVHAAIEAPPANGGLPNRLMTAFEVAEFVGCHEETVRRAYLRGLLISQRFGVRGRRFHPADVLDWIRRGAPTRVS